MAEQHLITAEYFGTPVSILDLDGRRWLTAQEAGRCLGYAADQARVAVGKIHARHEDEFTTADTIVTNLVTNSPGNPSTRIFSATGCIKLGFFAHTPTAKDFRAWAATSLAAPLASAASEETLPAVVRSPRLEAQVGRMAGSIETMAGSVAAVSGHLATLAGGMQTMQTQLNLTAKYIALLERNQSGTRRVTTEIIAEAKALKAEGMSHGDIARLLNISRTSVSLVVRDLYPIAQRERQAKPTTGEVLERWIEREQATLAARLEGEAS